MCGITGVIGETNKKEIKFLLKPVKHRGGKRNELTIFENGGIGINRLPIVDVKNGTQPVFNETKTVFAVMNGEIFNYKELKKELIQKGYFFKTNSDTEVIPHLYEEYGIDFPKYIDSEMYTIILFDKQRDKWIIARDFLGVKPLYYAKTNDKIYFSSEAKQLVAIKNINEIYIFPPGYLFVDKKFISHHTLNNQPLLDPSSSAIQQIQVLLDEAVKKRTPSAEKIGILLSGGIDSAAILVTALKYSKNIIAFIVGTKESIDRKYALRLCEYLGVEYKIINPTQLTLKDIKEVIKTVETDEKNTIRHSWVSYLACKEARKHNLKILLCGEGADELFGGYDVFKEISDKLNHKARKLLIENLYLSQLPRVDRTSMRFTLEMRCPFLDKKLIDLALNLKTTNIKGVTTKEILRGAMKDRLPEWITSRDKMPFSAGAGVIVDDEDSVFKKVILSTGMSEQEFIDKTYSSFGYDKIVKKEAINKDNLSYVLKHA